MKILTEIINSKKKEVKAIKEKYSYKDFESSSLFFFNWKTKIAINEKLLI